MAHRLAGVILVYDLIEGFWLPLMSVTDFQMLFICAHNSFFPNLPC